MNETKEAQQTNENQDQQTNTLGTFPSPDTNGRKMSIIPTNEAIEIDNKEKYISTRRGGRQQHDQQQQPMGVDIRQNMFNRTDAMVRSFSGLLNQRNPMNQQNAYTAQRLNQRNFPPNGQFDNPQLVTMNATILHKPNQQQPNQQQVNQSYYSYQNNHYNQFHQNPMKAQF